MPAYHANGVNLLIDQGFETMEGASGDDWISVAQSMRAYLRFSLMGGIVAEQIRRLGYSARVHSVLDGDVLQPPLLLLSGLGEVSRIGEVILNPFLGPRLKSGTVTTDLPMTPDRPIDFGLQRFCESCNKCARECPSGAITAGPKRMYNGYEIWKSDAEKCARYRITNAAGGMCGRCMKTCPWNLEGLLADSLWRQVAMKLPAAAPLLAKLDDALDRGSINPVKTWWWDIELDKSSGRYVSAALTHRRGLQKDLVLRHADQTLAATAAAAGLPPSQCEVYKIHLGGGFGRRGAVHDWVRQAVLIAKAMPGTPVKLLWSREEDMTHGMYHPITQCKLTAGLDGDGQLQALHLRISGQSILAGLFPQNVRDGRDPVVFQGLNPGGAESAIGYTVPHLRVDHAMRNPHVPPGFWRGVNLNQNTIYLECFLDEIAHATGQDPLALRRTLMKNHPKHLAVLEAAANRAGWGTPAPDVNGQKVFRGLAQTHGFGSYVAACAEVSVSDDGVLKIHRIVAATDPGHAVNPQQIEAQVEGSFVYGLSAALYGECTVKDGAIVQKNFDTYPSLKLADMPKVETIVMPSGGFWGGVVEPTIAVAAPAVLNAIFAATGKRICELPLKHHSLKRA